MTHTLADSTYEVFYDALRNGLAPDWVKLLREHAFNRFRELDFPTTRDENWRFTSLRGITDQRYAHSASAPLMRESQLEPYRIHGAESLVFINGFLDPSLSRFGPQLNVYCRTLTHAFESMGDVLQKHLTHVADYQDHPMVALNTAFVKQGVVLYLEPGVVLDEPLNIIHVASDDDDGLLLQPRHLIVLGEGAEATVVETYVSIEANSVLTNRVTEVSLGPNAKLRHVMRDFQNEDAANIGMFAARLDRDAVCETNALLFGGGLVRNEVHMTLDGEGAHAEAKGLYVGHGSQVHDNTIVVDHAKPNCTSEQFFKGLLDDSARAVFSGGIKVRKDAQLTDAKQNNRNLLLSDNARVNAKPALEIYADDVKCAHGSATGHIDEDALFYLKSRGIDPDTAMDLLVYAFAHEVIERMPLEGVRTSAERLLYERFAKARAIEES